MICQVLLWGLSKNDFYDFRLPKRLKLDMKREPQRNALQIIFGRRADGRGHLWKHQQKQICGLGVFICLQFAYMVFWVATPLKMMGVGNLRRNMFVPSKSKNWVGTSMIIRVSTMNICWVWNRVPQSPWLILIYVIMSMAIDWGYLDKPLILNDFETNLDPDFIAEIPIAWFRRLVARKRNDNAFENVPHGQPTTTIN